MMTLQTRLVLAISAVLLLAFVGMGVYSYETEREQAQADLLSQAKNVGSMAIAMKRVLHQQFVASDLPVTKSTIGFLPNHAMNRISADLSDHDKSGFSVNYVSNRPRNPNQTADEFELTAIDFFRQNPKEKVYTISFNKPDGSPFYLYATPIWIEEDCLLCHGNKGDAPQTIQDLYDTAFGYKSGDLRGILSIKLSTAALQTRVWNNLRNRFFFNLASFAFLLFLVTQIIRHCIHKPMTHLASGMKEISEGKLDKRVESLPGEFATLGRAFNKMAGDLKAQRAELEETNERFRLVFENSNDAIFVVDPPKDKIVNANTKACDMLGYSHDELLNTAMSKIHPYEMDSLQAFAESVFVKDAGWSNEFTCTTKTGEVIPVEMSASLFSLKNQTYMIIIVHDITKQTQTLLELKQYAETQKVLVREVNHRVQNNLTAIIGMLYKELDRAESGEITSAKNCIKDMTCRIEGLSTVHSLLSTSGWQPLLLTDLCRQVIGAALQIIPHDKEVTFTVAESSAKVNSDQAHHLAFVINELTTNCIKYALVDKSETQLNVDIQQDGEMVLIIFRDNGQGYPEEVIQNVGAQNSTGFDLIFGIVKESLRGQVTIKNDNGAVVEIVFKLTQDATYDMET